MIKTPRELTPIQKYIFKGSNSAMSIFNSILNWGQLIKAPSFRIEPILDGLCCLYKQTRSLEKSLKKVEKT